MAIVTLLHEYDNHVIEEILEAGVDGFATKSEALHLILPLAHSALRIKLMTDELKNLNRRLRRNNIRLVRKTQLDSLTGLYNMKTVWGADQLRMGTIYQVQQHPLRIDDRC